MSDLDRTIASIINDDWSQADSIRAVREVDALRARLAEVEIDRAALSAGIERLTTRLAEAERERDVYRKAKQENDERFMNERDTARAERDAARTERDAAVHKSNRWQWESERIGNNYRRELLRADGLVRELECAQKAYVARITHMAKFDEQITRERAVSDAEIIVCRDQVMSLTADLTAARAEAERLKGGSGHLTHRIEMLEAESAKLRCTLIEAAEQCDDARMFAMGAMLRKKAHGVPGSWECPADKDGK